MLKGLQITWFNMMQACIYCIYLSPEHLLEITIGQLQLNIDDFTCSTLCF